MQTLTEIRDLLAGASIRPQKQLGQNFLVDKNLLAKLLDIAQVDRTQTVLEVGAGTGTLTEELLPRFARVVAVELDRKLYELLRDRLGERSNLVLIGGDVLESKHAISPAVLHALGPEAVMLANLPYNIATPLIAEALVNSWRASCGPAGRGICRFDSLTFTVQQEVAERMTASAGSRVYGPISVLIALLSRAKLGPVVPAAAFWPRPKVTGQIVRIDFDPDSAKGVRDIDILTGTVNLAFAHRRKQIGTIIRAKQSKLPGTSCEALERAMKAANIERTLRPEQIHPEAFAEFANALAGGA